VEQAAVIAAVCHVAQEVLHGLGRLFGGQLHDDGAMVGLHLDFLTGKSQGAIKVISNQSFFIYMSSLSSADP
jgi:hypothetical protein